MTKFINKESAKCALREVNDKRKKKEQEEFSIQTSNNVFPLMGFYCTVSKEYK